MRRRFGIVTLIAPLVGAILLAGLLSPGGSAAAAEAASALTLAEAARLALEAGPQRQDVALSAARAEAGADLAESAFRWHVTVGTARIPQLAELSEQFGGALGDIKSQLAVLPLKKPADPTIVSPGTTGLVYDPVTGHRWAALPAVSAAKTFPSGGQLVLATHWGVFGPLNEASAQKNQEVQWQPFAKVPLIQFTQPLFRDPATLEPVLRREEAGRNLDRDRATARLTETRTLLDVAQAYFGVAQAQDEVEAAVRASSQAQTEARVRQDKAWKGDATGLDLMEADVLVQRAAARVEAARHALDLARQRLNRMLGRPLSLPVALAPPTNPPPARGLAPELAAAIAEALDRRPEIALARSAVDSARAQLKAARAAAGAQVSASAGVAKDKSWIAGVDVQWPLYDGGSGKAQVAQAAAALASAEKALADRQDDLTLQVTQAHYARQDAARAFAAAELAAGRARQAAALARERLEKGSAVSREVSSAEDALFEAEMAQRAALYRWYQAEWGWLAALGRLPGEAGS